MLTRIVLSILCLTAVSPHAGPTHLRLDRPLELFWTTTPSGLAYQVLSAGRGQPAARGDVVTIHEALSLPDGRLIFSTRTAGHSVTFTLGAHRVIPGVEEGVTGMRVGERRRLLVAPRLDGRTFDPGFIPANAVRVYDIEVLAIRAPSGRDTR